MTRAEALQMATSQTLTSSRSRRWRSSPVVRVMDFGKFLFEQNKKAHAAKRKQKQIQVKEVKFLCPGTEEADYQVKLRSIIRFLTEGDKAKVTLRYRGRELVHQDIGRRLLTRISEGPRTVFGGGTDSVDGRQADGHGVRAQKEVSGTA